MKLSEKITKLRKERGLSQEEFGNKINVSRQAVSKWESEQTKPDIDKLKEIANSFGVGFEYLLNDELDEDKNVSNNEVAKEPKKNRHIVIKILLMIIVIYLVISLYKFIALYRYYKMANSFSENNYWMYETYSENGNDYLERSIKKVENRKITETSGVQNYDEKESDDNVYITNHIEFIDSDKDICYELSWNRKHEEDVYYHDMKEDAINDEELKELLNVNKNEIKENTLSYIPSDFTSILLKSINPMYFVDVSKNTIYENQINGMKIRIVLTKDGLIQSFSRNTEFDGNMSVNMSYDYVQDHFTEIENPLDIYSSKIKKMD